MSQCPVCLSRDGFPCQKWGGFAGDGTRYDCEVCGSFIYSRTAETCQFPHFSAPLRAVLSRRLRLKTDSLGSQDNVPIVGTHEIKELIEKRPSLPSPAQQAANIIRYIGDYVGLEAKPLHEFPAGFHPRIGSVDRRTAEKITRELMERGLITGIDASDHQNEFAVIDLDLTLTGWEVFESEKRGNTSSRSGFIALKFGDQTLDALLNEHVKPKLEEIGHPLIDLRDVSRAGVIDNILRAQIQDASFVLADLTHDNAGAYWEAGYAEGLGKPVIYICERSKFSERQTHFDTNHCTTVMWSETDPDGFVLELAATIRRSLDYQ